ncbi:MAG: M23 family metallopeptidase [Alphaproteobacteria bacterium]|nr:MAG: M23 family metallopeptidase [Alphaproteobacteria bacterium]
MVSVIVKFFIEEVSFWSRYCVNVLRVFPLFFQCLNILVEIVSFTRVTFFVIGSYILFSIVDKPVYFIDELVESANTLAHSKNVVLKHNIDKEGISFSFSKEGLPLNQVTLILKAISEVVPSEWLHKAQVITKVSEQFGKYEFIESHIKGFGLGLHIQFVEDKAVLAWVGKDANNLTKVHVRKSIEDSLMSGLPTPIAKQVLGCIQNSQLNKENVVRVFVGYESFSKVGVFPKVNFVRLEYKDSKYSELVRIQGKIYDVNRKFSYNDLVVLRKPVEGRVSSNYGLRVHPIFKDLRMHTGIDYAAKLGTPIYAVADGVVVKAERHRTYGNYVEIMHPSSRGKICSGYAHMTKLVLAKNQKVKQGDVIGYVGSTGIATGAHLHHEMKVDGKFVNPNHLKTFYKKVDDATLKELNKLVKFYNKNC